MKIQHLTANCYGQSAAQQLYVPVRELIDFIGSKAMPALRTRSISTKVTDEEYSEMEALAGEQTISEWARDVLLKTTKLDTKEQILLAEVLALRTILLNALYKWGQGEPLTGEEMDRLIERADEERFSRAEERLAAAGTRGTR